MANYVQPTEYINYVSEFKKIFVNRNNAPTNQIFKIDSNISDEYYFQIVNKNNQIVSLSGRSFQIYGSLEDSKNIQHILFYTPSATIETLYDDYGNIKAENVLHFHINTYNQEYLAQITTNKQANITIVETAGNNTQVVLRDVCLCYKRPYIENYVPAEVYTVNILTGTMPWVNEFGAGQNINLIEGAPNFAFGSNLSTASNQFVVGDTNTPDGTKAFIVANSGNVFTVDYNGNVQAGAISASNIFISGQNFNEIVDGKIDELSTAIENIPTYSADNVTIQMNENNQFSIKSLETKLHAGLNVTLITDEAGNTTINAIDNSGQTILYYPGEGLSLVSTTFSVDKNWLDNKIVANVSGDFNSTSAWVNDTFETLEGDIGQISAFVSGLPADIAAKADLDDVYTKQNVYTYLETDQKILEATSGKADLSAIPTGNAQLQNTANYITAADIPVYTGVSPIVVDPETYEISYTGSSGGEGKEYSAGFGLALSGTSLSTFVLTATLSTIENDAGFITNADLANYALKSELINLEDVSGVVENYITVSGLATEGYVNGQIAPVQTEVDGLSSLVSAIMQIEFVSPQEAEQMIADATSAFVTSGQASEIASGVVEELSTTIRDGLATTSEIPTTVAELSDSSNYALTSQLIDSEDVSGIVEGYGYQNAAQVSAIASGYAGTDVDYTTVFDMLSSGDVDTLTITKDDEGQKIVFTATGGSTGGVTPTQVSSIVEGYGYQNAVQVSSIVEGYNYITASDLPAQLSGGTNIQIVDNEINFVNPGYITVDALADYAQTSAIPTKTSDLTNDSGYITTVTSADIPTSYVQRTELSAYAKTSAALSAISVNGNSTSAIVIDSADDDFSNDFQVYTYQDAVHIRFNGVDVMGYDSSTTHNDKFKYFYFDKGFVLRTSGSELRISLQNDIPTSATISGIASAVTTGYLADYTKTADLNIPTDGDISGIAEDVVESLSTTIRSGLATTSDISDMATQSWVGQQGFLTEVPNIYALKTDVDTASGAAVNAATGWVNAQSYLTEVPSEYITETELSEEGFLKDIPTSYVQRTELTAYATSSWVDENYAKKGEAPTDVYTKAEVNAISSALSTTVSEAGYLTEVPNTVSAAAVDAATGWVDVQNYLTEVPNTYALKTDIPTKTSDLTNDSNYISAITLTALSGSTEVESIQTTTIALASTDFLSFNDEIYIREDTWAKKTDIPTSATISSIVSAVTDNYVEVSGVWTGTGLELGSQNQLNVVLSAANNSNMIVDVDQDGVIWLSSIAQGGGTTYTAGSGITIDNGTIKTNLVAGNNVTFSITDNAVTINATGGGGGGGSSDLSDYNNDVPFITAEDITNKQRVNTVNGATITYDSAFEVFKTTYAGGDVTLNLVTALTSQIGNGEVATFEEWITFSSAVTSISEGSVNLIGVWPDTIDNAKTHVLVRRLINNAGTIEQYVSYAYNF